MIDTSPRRLEPVLLALALAFHGLGALSLLLLGRSPGVLLPAAAALALAAVAAHVWLNRVAPARDALLLPSAILLAGWGLLVIARVAPNFLGRQTAWLLVATIALLAVATRRDGLRWLRRFKYTWLILALGLLGMTLFLGVNPAGQGARLWLSLAGLFVQPSEILRLLMVAFLAAFFSERTRLDLGQTQDRLPARSAPAILSLIDRLRTVAPSILMWLIAIALLATQQDLGAAALLLITFVAMLYLASGRAALPLLGMAALVIGGIAGYFASSRVAQRVDIWLNPWADPQDRSFQIVQSLIAVASGTVLGQGIGQGRPDYVPAIHTDFPFAAISEELGLFGSIGLLVIFAVLVLRGWRVAQRARTSYGMLLAGGLSVSLLAQLFVIVGGNLGLVPLTGVTLPFISYGGSSLLVSFITVGLLIRLSDDTAVHPAPSSAQAETRVSHSPLPAFGPSIAQHVASRRAMRLSAALILAMGLAAGYWGVARSADLSAREDNPRLVDAERAIRRGPILARDGAVLAQSLPAPDVGTEPEDIGATTPYDRHYPHPEVAPAVGYYSWRHGTGGVETYADSVLRGNLTAIDRLLHRPQIGAAFTTTIDLTLQQRLFGSLRGTTSAGLIMDWQTGEVLALVSMPSYDASKLDADWDQLRADRRAPLLNRVTQGLYQPGPLLQWLYRQSGAGVEPATSAGFEWDRADRFSLGQPAPFELENASVPYPASGTYSETIGQGALRITPLRVTVATAALVAGRPVTPTLIHSDGHDDVKAHTLPRLDLSEPVIHFAQIGKDQHVGWLIMASDERVIVVALEQAGVDPARLEQISRDIEPALQPAID